MKKLRKLRLGSRLAVSLAALLVLLPIVITLLYSLFSPGEIVSYLNTRNDYTGRSAMEIKVIPNMVSLMQYYRVMITDQTIRFAKNAGSELYMNGRRSFDGKIKVLP